MIFQVKRASDQFETKINRYVIPMKGTQEPYSSPIWISPIWILLMFWMNSRTYSKKFLPSIEWFVGLE